MKTPKTFINQDLEKLFDNMLRKNYQRETKLESIEDLILKDIPDEIKEKYRIHQNINIMQPRYVTRFDDKDTELDNINFNALDLDFIKRIHVTNFDVGLYKLDLLIIESKSERKLRENYETILNYERDMNEYALNHQVRHLIKGRYIVLLVDESRLDIQSPIFKKIHDYYKEKFDMKRVNVRKVVELV